MQGYSVLMQYHYAPWFKSSLLLDFLMARKMSLASWSPLGGKDEILSSYEKRTEILDKDDSL